MRKVSVLKPTGVKELCCHMSNQRTCWTLPIIGAGRNFKETSKAPTKRTFLLTAAQVNWKKLSLRQGPRRLGPTSYLS